MLIAVGGTGGYDYSCSAIAYIEDRLCQLMQHINIFIHHIHSPFPSHGLFKRWSPFMGCCRRDFRPVMELRCPPVSEPAGWVQLPNCGLAPAGRSGVGSWESCLDILDQTGSQKDTWGTWRGEANWPEYLPIGQVWLCVSEQEGWGWREEKNVLSVHVE